MTFWLCMHEDVAFCRQKQATQVLQRYVCSLGWSVTKTKVLIINEDLLWIISIAWPQFQAFLVVGVSMWRGKAMCGIQYTCYSYSDNIDVTVMLKCEAPRLVCTWTYAAAGVEELVRKWNLFAPCSDPYANKSLCALSVMVQSHSYQGWSGQGNMISSTPYIGYKQYSS